MRLKILVVSIAALMSFGFGMVTETRSSDPAGLVQYRPVDGLSELQARQAMISNSVRIKQGFHGGSGVLIYDGMVLTAFHVVSDIDFVTGLFEKSSVEINGVVTDGWEVAYWNGSSDLALLTNPNIELGRRRFAGLSNSVEIGERVIASGFPILEGPYLTEGYVSEMPAGDSMKVSASGTSGSSGSGLYNTKGQLVGIIHRGYVGHDFMMLAVPLKDLHSFFNDIVKGRENSGGSNVR